MKFPNLYNAVVHFKQIEIQIFLQQNTFIQEKNIITKEMTSNGKPGVSPEKQSRVNKSIFPSP